MRCPFCTPKSEFWWLKRAPHLRHRHFQVIPKIATANQGGLRFQSENPQIHKCRWGFGSLKSMWLPQNWCRRRFAKSMSVTLWNHKIDVGDGLNSKNRCRWWFEFQKSMAKRDWTPKIDVGDGLDFKNRCRWCFGPPKSMSVMLWIRKIDVGDGLNFKNRWRRGFEFQKSMARRVWIPKIDGEEGLDFKNRWRRGFGFQKSMAKRVWISKIDGEEGFWFFKSKKSMYQMRSGTLTFAILGCPDFSMMFGFPTYPVHWFLTHSPKTGSMYQMGSGTLKTYDFEGWTLIWFLGHKLKINVGASKQHVFNVPDGVWYIDLYVESPNQSQCRR